MNLAESLLQEVVAWCSAIAMIVLVVFLVKDVIAVMRGDGTIGKVLVKVLVALLLLGIMFATKSFEVFGNMFSNFFKEVVTEDHLPNITP